MKKYRYEYNFIERLDSCICADSLFIDIETTGFNRTSTFLTIIGLSWQENDTFIIEQWFNESGHSEEPLLLLELERFLKSFDQKLPKLIHYNGTTFDLPYLKSKYEQYHLPTSLCSCDSLDLYHMVKKYRNFLSLEGIKQKNLEECFGLFREDKLSGQELIHTYLQGIQYKDQQLLDDYLLHNKEDMEGMVFLVHLLKLDQFFHGNFEIMEWTTDEERDFIRVKLMGDFHLYKPISISHNHIHYTFESNTAWLQIPTYQMEARFFYDNYKDYYYLPKEDVAMHKSVAEYVEKEYRVKATKETCYTKKNGSFLPLPLPSAAKLRKSAIQECHRLSLFYKCYGECTAYLLNNLTNTEQKIYITQILKRAVE